MIWLHSPIYSNIQRTIRYGNLCCSRSLTPQPILKQFDFIHLLVLLICTFIFPFVWAIHLVFLPICSLKWILSNSEKYLLRKIFHSGVTQNSTHLSTQCIFIIDFICFIPSFIIVVFFFLFIRKKQSLFFPFHFNVRSVSFLLLYACLIQLRNTFIHSLKTISMISNKQTYALYPNHLRVSCLTVATPSICLYKHKKKKEISFIFYCSARLIIYLLI